MCALPRLRPAPEDSIPRERTVLVILGPTASGKTALSIPIARRLNGEILSADSRQIYTLLDIGTAKPTQEERRQVKHHFVDDLDPACHFDASEFGRKGRIIIEDIFSRKRVPIIVGGSGLYIQGLVDGFFEGPSADDELRARLEERLRRDGAEELLRELQKVDPVAAAKMHPSFTRRIIRALEVYHLTGIPISRLQETRAEVNFRTVFVGLQWPRDVLYRRINRRVDRMLADGLVEEVRRIRALGYPPELKGLQTTGYVEVFPFLDGRTSYDAMVEEIKRNTRRYAKRQLTWFRHDDRIHWFRVESEDQFPALAELIVEHFVDAAKWHSQKSGA
jgi:tRNA dimethylallyltransferase